MPSSFSLTNPTLKEIILNAASRQKLPSMTYKGKKVSIGLHALCQELETVKFYSMLAVELLML